MLWILRQTKSLVNPLDIKIKSCTSMTQKWVGNRACTVRLHSVEICVHILWHLNALRRGSPIDLILWLTSPYLSRVPIPGQESGKLSKQVAS